MLQSELKAAYFEFSNTFASLQILSISTTSVQSVSVINNIFLFIFLSKISNPFHPQSILDDPNPTGYQKAFRALHEDNIKICNNL